MNQNPVVVPLYRSTPRIREEIGSYRPCFEIGAGGMATVVLARETCGDGLQRTVALKILHEHLARDAELRRRFLDEAQLLACVNHPGVCRVLDFGEDRGTAFVAMEYLVGEKLSGLFSALERRSTEVTAFHRARLFSRVIADLADGLHAAHEARDAAGNSLGIVHHDVTPDNLFVLYDGTVRVADFGMARYRNKQLYAATTGRLLGKLWYMAPEQALSEPIDRRIDVWGLGVALWELVTLRRLFKRNNQLETMRAVCSEPVPLLSTYVDGVPSGLDAIICRALERNPILRYQTAQELAQALNAWLLANAGRVTRTHLSEFLNGFFPQSGCHTLSVRPRMQSGFESGPFSERGSGVVSSERSSAPVSEATSSAPIAERFHREPRAEDVTGVPASALPTLRPPARTNSSRVPLRASVPVSSRRPIEEEGRVIEVELPEKQYGELWVSLRDSVWRIAVPVAPILFTLGLLLAAQLDLSHRSRAALGSFDTVSLRLSRLQLQLEPEAPSAPLPVATGEVVLVSERPGVRVYRDGELVGETPLTLRLPQGPATLQVQAREDGPTKSLHFDVRAARARVVSVESPR